MEATQMLAGYDLVSLPPHVSRNLETIGASTWLEAHIEQGNKFRRNIWADKTAEYWSNHFDYKTIDIVRSIVRSDSLHEANEFIYAQTVKSAIDSTLELYAHLKAPQPLYSPEVVDNAQQVIKRLFGNL